MEYTLIYIAFVKYVLLFVHTFVFLLLHDMLLSVELAVVRVASSPAPVVLEDELSEFAAMTNSK